jgi:aquaporin Z
MPTTDKLVAELIGTFTLVAAVLGAALISFGALGGGSGILGVAFAVGLAVMVMAYAVGPISGGHFNPAVTLGLYAAGRFEAQAIIPYVAAQVVGGLLAGAFFYLVLTGKTGFAAGAVASNGYGAHSPDGFSLMSGLLTEIVLTAIFIFVICRVTAPKGAGNMAPVAIGLTLTLLHIMSIPVDNTSLNPARSTATVLFAHESWPLAQLWLFWVAPIIGGLLGGIVHKSLGEQV